MGPSLPHYAPLRYQHVCLCSHHDHRGGGRAVEGVGKGQTWFMGSWAQHMCANPKWPVVAPGAELDGPEWQWRGGSPPLVLFLCWKKSGPRLGSS